MDKKLVKKYWDEVNRRAWEDAMNKSGFKLLIPTVATLLAAFGISGLFVAIGLIKYSVFEDNLIANTITGISQVVISLFLLAFFYDRMLHETPPKMYQELGGFVEIPFEIKSHRPYPKRLGEPRWASIDIINISPFIVEKCYVEINSALDSKGKSVIDMPRNLKWSWGHEEENRKKELDVFRTPKVCDVAVAIPEQNIVFLETWAGQNFIGKGVYDIEITVHGLWKGLLRSKSFKLVLEYKGSNIITIRGKGEGKWKDENPKVKVLKTKGIKKPSVSSDSSS